MESEDTKPSETDPLLKKGVQTEEEEEKSNDAKSESDPLPYCNRIDFLTIILSITLVLIAPYNKVEESFYTQGLYDMCYNSENYQDFDHYNYPGVVPRSFIPTLTLTGITSFVCSFAKYLDISKLFVLIVARSSLAVLVIYCFLAMKQACVRKLGRGMDQAMSMVLLLQFHFLFYSGRFLGNIFAMMAVFFAFRFYVVKSWQDTVYIITAVCVVLRFEVAVLLLAVALAMIIFHRVSVVDIFLWVVRAGVVSVVLTVAFDSYFFNKITWPEFETFYFNVVMNKSHEWGTAPALWYFTSSLPKMFLASNVFFVFALFLRKTHKFCDIRMLEYAFIFLFYVAIFSLLPHKETRFLYPIIPVAVILMGYGLSKATGFYYKSNTANLGLFVVSILLLMVNVLPIFLMTYVSSYNYPAAQALLDTHWIFEDYKDQDFILDRSRLKLIRQKYLETYLMVNTKGSKVMDSQEILIDLLRTEKYQNCILEADALVHIDEFSAQNGVSLFLERPNWCYFKTEGLSPGDLQIFTHALSREPHVEGFENVHHVDGFSKINWKKGGLVFGNRVNVHQNWHVVHKNYKATCGAGKK